MADGNAAVRVWSPMQEAIFAAVENTIGGNLIVEALAGTGKSTTLEEIVRRTDPDASVLVCAFNTSIAKALEPRMPVGVTVKTIHSFGFAALRAASTRRIEINRFRTADAVQGILGRGHESRDARAFCSKLISIAKGNAFDACEAGGTPKLDTLDAMADAQELLAPKGWSRGKLLGVALQVLRAQQLSTSTEIDFDDMIWLPVVRQIAIPQFDFVLVDELQDLNPAQIAICVEASAEGRFIGVGDRHQAIYGFRGADREAIPRMVRELRADVLPLSITYRCARSIVTEANEIVPALEAAPGAPLGTVRHASLETLERDVAPGDFVLSRTNAPLVSLCFRLIKAGRRAAIQGRDIGDGLAAWVRGTKAADVPELLRCVRDWRISEIARLDALERDTDGVTDRAECLIAIAEGAKSVAEVMLRIESIFSGEAPGGRVLLSSTHRAKGLEAERVWLLHDTYCQRPGAEESNLLYVAITRAKSELIYAVEEVPESESSEPAPFYMAADCNSDSRLDP